MNNDKILNYNSKEKGIHNNMKIIEFKEEGEDYSDKDIKNNNEIIPSSPYFYKESNNNKKIQKIYTLNDINKANSSKKMKYSGLNDKKKQMTNLIKIAEDIYNKDVHFQKNSLLVKKKTSSQNHLINIKNFVRTENKIKNTSISKNDKILNIYKKSLFHGTKNILDEEGLGLNKKMRESAGFHRKTNEENKTKKGKINNFAAFFKLKAKEKKPQKVFYMDSIINHNTNNHNTIVTKMNSFNKNEFKEQTVKSVKTFKSYKSFKTENKNLIFNIPKIDEYISKKKSKEAEIIELKTKNKFDSKIEDNKNQIKINEIINNTNKETTIKKFKCIPFQIFCCLNYNVD